jgi:chromosome partitioning protein
MSIPQGNGAALSLPFSEALSKNLQHRVREILDAIAQEAQHRVYVVADQKGGAGKTTTAVTVCAVWASWGLIVRLVDCDPSEGTATWWIPPIYPDDGPRHTLREVFLGKCTLDEATYPTSVPGLYIVPSDDTLEEIERAGLPGVEQRLKAAIAASTRHFDKTVLDTRPSLNVLTTAAMTAADELWFSLNGAALDTAGLARLAQHREDVKEFLNRELETTGTVIVRFGDTKLARDIRGKLMTAYPDAVHATIPKSVRIEEAPAYNLPITEYAPKERCTAAYAVFAAEVLTQDHDRRRAGLIPAEAANG